jgi:hypothetical protein
MVAAAHNEYESRWVQNKQDGWPTRWGSSASTWGDQDSVDGLIIVGGTNINTRIGQHSPYASWLVMAPGWDVNVARGLDGIGPAVGNSLGKSDYGEEFA